MIIFSLNMMMVVAAPVDVDTMDMMLQKAEEAPCGGKGKLKIQNDLKLTEFHTDNPCPVTTTTKKPCKWVFDKSSMRYFTVCDKK